MSRYSSSTPRPGRRHSPPAIVRLQLAVNGKPHDAVEHKAQQRKTIANFCKAVGNQFHAPAAADTIDPLVAERLTALSQRMRETLERMLAGDSEKEIGVHLKRSKNTVHVYVTQLYRHFGVNSRGELLSHFVRPIKKQP